MQGGFQPFDMNRRQAHLEILPQIHAAIQRRHLIGIAVEQQRRLAFDVENAAGADEALGGLRPARMIDVRVHVGVKPYSFGADWFQVVGG